MAKKVLVVLTSVDKFPGSDKKTGWYLPEFAHPYDALVAAGVEVTVASPKGGLAPLDPASVEMFKSDESSVRFLNDKKALWEKTQRLADFAGKAGEYDAIFYPGGHGPMFDLATDAESQKLAADFYDAGKVVAAVCHGPAALVNVTLGSGKALVEGKQVTGFSNGEEDAVDLSKFMPFMLETALDEKSGGKFVKADKDWGEKVVVDGRLITGQNPASAKGVGDAIVKAIGA